MERSAVAIPGPDDGLLRAMGILAELRRYIPHAYRRTRGSRVPSTLYVTYSCVPSTTIVLRAKYRLTIPSDYYLQSYILRT